MGLKKLHFFKLGTVLLLILTGCDLIKTDTGAPLARLDQPPVGRDAPKFSLPSLSGKTVSLSDFRGKVVVLNFWALWCAPCVAEMPSLGKLQRTLGGEKLEVVAVNLDPPASSEEVAAFIKNGDYTFTVLLDPDLTTVNQYGVGGFPETFFISPEGKFLAIDDPESGDQRTKLISDHAWDTEPYLKSLKALIGQAP